MTTSANDSGSTSWLVWAAGATVGCVVIRVLVELISDVCSVNGLLYSFGLAAADGIAFPLATRLLTWACLLELCALAGMGRNYCAGRWKDHWATNLLLGHVTLCGWIYRVLRSAAGALYSAGAWALARARGPRVEVLMAVEPSDFDALAIENEAA